MRYEYKHINIYHYVPKSVYDRVKFIVQERGAFQEKWLFLIFTEDRCMFPLLMCMDDIALISFLVLFIICLPMCLSLYSFIFTNLSAVSLSMDLNLSGGNNANLPHISTPKKIPISCCSSRSGKSDRKTEMCL